jgi:hypothetical protein
MEWAEVYSRCKIQIGGLWEFVAEQVYTAARGCSRLCTQLHQASYEAYISTREHVH